MDEPITETQEWHLLYFQKQLELDQMKLQCSRTTCLSPLCLHQAGFVAGIGVEDNGMKAVIEHL